MVAFGVFIPSPLSSLAATASSLRCGEAVIEVGRAECGLRQGSPRITLASQSLA